MKKLVIISLLCAQLFAVQDGGWLGTSSGDKQISKISCQLGEVDFDLPISQARLDLLKLDNAEIWHNVRELVDNILNSQDDHLKGLRGQPMTIEEILNLVQIYGKSVDFAVLRQLTDLLVANVKSHHDLLSVRLLQSMMHFNLIEFPSEVAEKFKHVLDQCPPATMETISLSLPQTETDFFELIDQAENDAERLTLELNDPCYLFYLGLSLVQKNPVLAHLYLERAATMGVVEARQQVEILTLREKLKICFENLQLTQAAQTHQEAVQIIKTRLKEIKAAGNFFTKLQVDLALLEYNKKDNLDADEIRKSLLADSAAGFKHVIADLGEDVPSEMIQAGIFFKAKDYFDAGMIKQTDLGDSPAAGLAKLAIIDCTLRKNITVANFEGCMSNITDLNSVLKKGNGKQFFAKFDFIGQFENIRKLDFPPQPKNELMKRIGLICLDNNQRAKGLDFLKASGLEQSDSDHTKFTLAVLELENAAGDTGKACQQLEDLILLKNDFNSLFFCCTNYHQHKKHFTELTPVCLATRTEKKLQEFARNLKSGEADSKLKFNVLSNALVKFIKFHNLYKHPEPEIAKIIDKLNERKEQVDKNDDYCFALGQMYLERQEVDKCQAIIASLGADKGKELFDKLQVALLPGATEYNEAVSLTQTIFVDTHGLMIEPDETIKKQVDDEALRLVGVAAGKGHILAKLTKALWLTGKNGERYVPKTMNDKLRALALEKALADTRSQESPLLELADFKRLESDALARLSAVKSSLSK
jgi:hypothetical protein